MTETLRAATDTCQVAGEWNLDGQDEATMQRQRFLWNTLVDHWFRMEMDGWENPPEAPVLLVGIHSGAPFVWDAWTVGVQWWRRFGQERPLHGTAHDALMAIPVIGRYFRAMGVLPAAPDSIATALAEGREGAVWPGGAMASTLFISPKTLEANLTRIHRKLNIHSRAELGRIMGQFDS
jgi:hypothetical protein